jgi:transcriptional regulator with XRE-family HTH domain
MTEATTAVADGLHSPASKRLVRNKDLPLDSQKVPLDSKRVRDRMVQARVMNGLTAVEAAARLGYANSTQLSQIESGKRKVPDDWRFLLRMSQVYAVSVDYLLGVSPHPERDPVAAESFAMLRGFEELLKAQALATTTAFIRFGKEKEAARGDLQEIAAASKAVSTALTRFRELNPEVDEDMKGANTLLVAVDKLEGATVQIQTIIDRRAVSEEQCHAIARGEQGPMSFFVTSPQLALGLE